MRKSLLVAAAIVSVVSFAGVSVLTFTSCKGKSKTEAVGSVEELPSVKIERSYREKVAQSVDFTANLEAYKQTYIIPSISARIEKLNVDVGDKVRKGQILAELDKTQYNTNALQLANAELNFARMQPVYETGGISKQEIDAAQTNIDVLKETVANLEENVRLRSPFDGVVTMRNNEEGDLFSAMSGTGIYQVMQMSPLKAYVFVSEQYFPQVYAGMPVEVRVDVYPDREFTGKVSRIAPSIDPSSRTFKVEVTVPNAELTLRPGMYARTTFNMGEVDNVTVLDVAVQRLTGTNDKYVYVLKDDDTVESRFVTTGRQVGDRVEILSGLSEVEKAVITGAARLLDGVKVQVVDGVQE